MAATYRDTEADASDEAPQLTSGFHFFVDPRTSSYVYRRFPPAPCRCCCEASILPDDDGALLSPLSPALQTSSRLVFGREPITLGNSDREENFPKDMLKS